MKVFGRCLGVKVIMLVMARGLQTVSIRHANKKI